VRLVGALAAALLLAGCWVQQGAGPGRNHFNGFERAINADTVDSLEFVWGGSGPSRVIGEPILVADKLIVTTRNSFSSMGSLWAQWEFGVTALDVNTGDVVWSNEQLLGPETFGLVDWGGYGAAELVDGAVQTAWSVSAGTSVCHVGTLRINPDSGAVVGISTAFESSVVRVGTVRAALVGGNRCSGAATDQLYLRATDTSTGTTWTSAGPAGSGTVVALGDPPASDLTVLVAGDRLVVDRQVYAAGGCGAPTCAPLGTTGNAPILASAAVGTHVFHLRSTGLERWDVAGPTPQLGWSSSFPVTGSEIGLASDGTHVFAVDGGDIVRRSRMHAFRVSGCGASTCAPLWSTNAVKAPLSYPVIAGGLVYVNSFDSDQSEFGIDAYDAAGCGAAVCSPVSSRFFILQVRSLLVSQQRLFAVDSNLVVAFRLPRD
jgi:hypothetical protein